jgi:hypothetical protein
MDSCHAPSKIFSFKFTQQSRFTRDVLLHSALIIEAGNGRANQVRRVAVQPKNPAHVRNFEARSNVIDASEPQSKAALTKIQNRVDPAE